jgi:hypothetical protein
MIGDRHETARMQSDFYRNNYYRVLRLLLFSTGVMLSLILAIIYFVLVVPPTPYYAMTTTGQIITLHPENK